MHLLICVYMYMHNFVCVCVHVCVYLQIADDVLSIQFIMVMLVVDTLLYMLLAWYIEGVWPGRYGIAKPLHFPLQPSHWLGQKWSFRSNLFRFRFNLFSFRSNLFFRRTASHHTRVTRETGGK